MSKAHIEILIHSAAPTSKREDDRMRAQALSILGFLPENRTHITSLLFPKNMERAQRVLGASNKPFEGSSACEGTSTSTTGEELLEQSVECISTLISTDKQISESVIYGTGEQYASPAQLSPLVDYRVGMFSQQSNSSAPEGVAQKPDPAESFRLPSPAQDGAESDSSYATSRFDSWQSPPASNSDSQPPPSSDPFAVPAARAEGGYTDETGTTVFPALPVVSFCYNPPPTTSTLAPLSPRQESSLPVSDYSLSSLHSNYALPPAQSDDKPRSPPLRVLLTAGEIHELISPPPETNSTPVLITPQLREMTDVGDLLVGKYQKLKRAQTRELRKWERGHWRVDMSSWEGSNEKINFWNILKDNVEHGRLGPVNAFLGEAGAGDVVKVYCHGGMVEHLWCALFVMSSRNSRNATWVDAGDNTIIMF